MNVSDMEVIQDGRGYNVKHILTMDNNYVPRSYYLETVGEIFQEELFQMENFRFKYFEESARLFHGKWTEMGSDNTEDVVIIYNMYQIGIYYKETGNVLAKITIWNIEEDMEYQDSALCAMKNAAAVDN